MSFAELQPESADFIALDLAGEAVATARDRLDQVGVVSERDPDLADGKLIL
jgi:hypothetical protein